MILTVKSHPCVSVSRNYTTVLYLFEREKYSSWIWTLVTEFSVNIAASTHRMVYSGFFYAIITQGITSLFLPEMFYLHSLSANIYFFKVNNKKHWKNVWNNFKVNNQNTRMMPFTWFWCFYVNIFQTLI